MALSGVTERQSHGEAAWFTPKGRAFVTCADRHHDDRVAIWLAAPPGAQETLVASDPTRFFRPPYYGTRGWIGVYVDVPIDWPELERLIADGYGVIAGRPR